MDTAPPGKAVRTRIACLGSAYGDDQAAWLVAEQLRLRGIPADIRTLREPFELLEALAGVDRVILVDAAMDRHGQLAPGTILEMSWPDHRLDILGSSSTHGFTAARVLALAQQLNRLPAELRLLVVGIEQCRPQERLSDTVARALPQLLRRIEQMLERNPRDREHADSASLPSLTSRDAQKGAGHD